MVMGHVDSLKPAELIHTIRNERDYLETKKLIAHEMRVRHQDDASERIESLMRAVTEYEQRFADNSDQDGDGCEDCDDGGLADWDGPDRRWGDHAEA
jgi:hypothetical protein